MNTYPKILTYVSKMNGFIKNKLNTGLIAIVFSILNITAILSYQSEAKNYYNYTVEEKEGYIFLSGINIGMSYAEFDMYLNNSRENNHFKYDNRTYNDYQYDDAPPPLTYTVNIFTMHNESDTLHNVQVNFIRGYLYTFTADIPNQNSNLDVLLNKLTSSYGNRYTLAVKTDRHKLSKYREYTWLFDDWTMSLAIQDSNYSNTNNHTLMLTSNNNWLSNEIIPDNFNIVSFEEIERLQNEIYARKGIIFEDTSLSLHFSKYYWYSPQIERKNIVLSSLELKNINILSSFKLKEKKRRLLFIDKLLEIESTIKKSNKATLKYFKRKYIQDKLSSQYDMFDIGEYRLSDFVHNLSELKSTLLYLRSDNIIEDLTKNTKCHYSIEVEDDESTSYLNLSFEWNKVIISSGGDEKYIDGEGVIIWTFTIDSGRLILVDIFEAG